MTALYRLPLLSRNLRASLTPNFLLFDAMCLTLGLAAGRGKLRAI